MARKNVARILSDGLVSLCVILLFSVDSSGQFTITKKTFTISGTVGLGGVVMKGLPGAAIVTDESGSYSAIVDFNWTGTVTPTKVGYSFEPVSRNYSKVAENQANQDYKASLISFTISGITGIPGVELKGLPDNPVSGAGGAYSVKVPYGFSGTVTPAKEGYTFTPESKPYTSVTSDQTNQNYTGTPITFTLTGSTGVDGVVMKGLPGDPLTGADGSYKVTVTYGWNGVVAPTKLGYNFDPPSREYANINGPMASQNYIGTLLTFKISGSTGMPGVTMSGLPGNPVSDEKGSYSAVVDYGWAGTVTPLKEGVNFAPPKKPYSGITADQIGQDYTGTPITYTISGTTSVGGVTMNGLPGNPLTDANGNYKVVVNYGWNGTIVPEKAGYSFQPPTRTYPKVVSDQANQTYTASKLKFLVSGAAGVAGVTLKGLPGNVVSGNDGTYSVSVDYGWAGKVTPIKEGYTFEPTSRDYSDLNGAQPGQDFAATMLKRTITGKIDSERGPVEGVTLVADGGANAKTDASGVYALSVDYGWRGKVYATREGYTFKPSSKAFEAVIVDQTGQNYTAEVRMLTISGRMDIEGTPLPGVKMTANNGGSSDVTDADGRYKVKVPYGWTGELTPTKEGFDFVPPSFPHANVTQDIKEGEPEKPKPSGESTGPTGPGKETVTQPGGEKIVEPTVPKTSEKIDVGVPEPDADKKVLLEQVKLLQAKIDAMMTKGPGLLKVPEGELVTKGPGDIVGPIPSGTERLGPKTPGAVQEPFVTAMFIGTDLKEALREMATQSGINIYVDDTVKATPVTCQLSKVHIEAALQTVLKGTNYVFKRIPKSYLVYAPINNTFVAEDIRAVLETIATQAKVVIVPDENVTGTVSCELKDVPLETALEIVLAGSGLIVKRTPNYYLVGSPKPEQPIFPAVSETRRIGLSYVRADRAVALLSPAFRNYAMSDANAVCVTAPPTILERVIADLREIDKKPRHVLLDARVVVMERANLLNIGVEWTWPNAKLGVFGSDHFDRGGSLGGPAVSDASGKWPWGVQIGYSPDGTFTDMLALKLNLLTENGEADIVASPQVLAQDGKVAEIKVMTEEYFMLVPPQGSVYYATAQMATIESGTTLTITPRIGDNNDINLEMAVEVSDSIPRGVGSGLPVVTRRTARNAVRVLDGGTVALAGLTESKNKVKEKKVPGLSNLPLIGNLFTSNETDRSSREIAVFITAHLVHESENSLGVTAAESSEQAVLTGKPAEPAGEEFKQSLKASLSRQPASTNPVESRR